MGRHGNNVNVRILKRRVDMASVNKVIVVGNLGKDPETRFLPDGKAVCNFSVATTDKWTDKATNEKKEATEWHRVSTFGRLAEICGEYLKKGSQVYIEGKLRTRKWQDKEGQDRYTTEIVGNEMQMLGGRGGGGGAAAGGGGLPEASPRADVPENAAAGAGVGAGAGASRDEFDDDIPF